MKVNIALAAVAAAPFVAAAPSGGPGRGHGSHNKVKYPDLDVLAKKAGLEFFGTAVDNVVLDNEQYTSIAYNRSEFGQITPSNGQKWMYTEPQRNKFNYTMANEIIKPSRRAGQIHRCHAFVWHNQLADWVAAGNFSKKELISIMENHIKNEARAFYDVCLHWDVVNEAFEDDGTWRKSLFYETIGPEYIELAFKFARKYVSPKTKLYYNDYNIEKVGNKSLAVAELVKDFQKRRIPIDGVGMQAHFTVGRSPTYEQISETMAMFNKLKMEVALTELDVRIALPSDAQKEADQAKIYADSVKACVHAKGKGCAGVTVWDFWDPVSWVPSTFPGNGDACIWAEDFRKKPAYYAIADMLIEEAKR